MLYTSSSNRQIGFGTNFGCKSYAISINCDFFVYTILHKWCAGRLETQISVGSEQAMLCQPGCSLHAYVYTDEQQDRLGLRAAGFLANAKAQLL